MAKSKTSVDTILSQVSGDGKQIPPVELWDPPYCGEMNLVIKADGVWHIDNSPIGRKRLFKLFSTIIKFEQPSYFLVTPVEKLKIKVEWQPFVIIDFQIIQHNNRACFQFVDNCDNQILLISSEQLRFSEYNNQKLPIIQVRRNLFASFSRSCYYRLINQAELQQNDNHQQLTIHSNGKSFCLGKIANE